MSKLIGNTEFNTASHSVFRLTYHVIWVVKFRRHILNAGHRDFLWGILREAASLVNCQILECNGEDDHIHFLMDAPPTIMLSETMGKLKAKTARALLDRFGSFFWGKHERTVWSSGFFVASTGGVTLDILKAYIENQGRTPSHQNAPFRHAK